MVFIVAFDGLDFDLFKVLGKLIAARFGRIVERTITELTGNNDRYGHFFFCIVRLRRLVACRKTSERHDHYQKQCDDFFHFFSLLKIARLGLIPV